MDLNLVKDKSVGTLLTRKLEERQRFGGRLTVLAWVRASETMHSSWPRLAWSVPCFLAFLLVVNEFTFKSVSIWIMSYF